MAAKHAKSISEQDVKANVWAQKEREWDWRGLHNE